MDTKIAEGEEDQPQAEIVLRELVHVATAEHIGIGQP